jgi:hypothetical protein
VGHWPLASGPVLAEPQAGTSQLTSVTLTGSGTAHTKGNWGQIDAAIPAGVKGLIVSVNATNLAATNTSMLMDIGVGGAGSELVVVANLGIGYKQNAGHMAGWIEYIPLALPDGVRLAARIQGAVVSDTAVTSWQYVIDQGIHPVRSFAACETMGADTGTSRGVTVTANATINTPGAWAEIVASTPTPIHALLPTIQANGQTTMVTRFETIEIGVGGAGAEQIIIPKIGYRVSSTSEELNPYLLLALSGLVDVNIPVGSRLAARVTSSVASTTTDVILHGFRR